MELEVAGDEEWLGVNVNVACRKAVKLCKWNGDKKCWENIGLKLTQIGKQSQQDTGVTEGYRRIEWETKNVYWEKRRDSSSRV